jgi:hypothetical protein
VAHWGAGGVLTTLIRYFTRSDRRSTDRICVAQPNRELDAYLSQHQEEAELLQRKLEDRFDSAGMRARLLARRTSANAS